MFAFSNSKSTLSHEETAITVPKQCMRRAETARDPDALNIIPSQAVRSSEVCPMPTKYCQFRTAVAVSSASSCWLKQMHSVDRTG